MVIVTGLNVEGDAEATNMFGAFAWTLVGSDWLEFRASQEATNFLDDHPQCASTPVDRFMKKLYNTNSTKAAEVPPHTVGISSCVLPPTIYGW
jgi:hypothetical protein